MHKVLQLLLLSLALPFFARAQNSPDAAALTAATHDLCPVQIAMLGESNTHGDGHTEVFKVALVQRLINDCHFDSVYFEANQAQFIHLNQRLRAEQPVTADDISNAIGGIWKFDNEFKPLIPFLLAKAQSGQIVLGGIDDQLGQLEQDYANVTMVTELMSVLPQPQRDPCVDLLHHRIYSDYTDAAPYTPSIDSQINACLTASRHATAVDKAIEAPIKEDRLQMISATQRWISRGVTVSPAWFAGRDHSMFLDFEWLRRQQPLRHKIIVWAATIHIAKEMDAPQTDETAENFGYYIHQKYASQAFSLGFAALTGSFRVGRHEVQPLPASPQESLEARTMPFTGTDAVYIGPTQLASMGTLPGAVISHHYETLAWASLVDGVVVFRAERAKESSQPAK